MSSSVDRTRTSLDQHDILSTSNPILPTTEYVTTTTSRYLTGSRPPTGYRSRGRPSTARPRTGISTLGVENQEIICAVNESRGVAPFVGLSFVNLDTGEAVLSQISDSQTYVKTLHKLSVFVPTIILVVSSAASPNTKLLSIIQDNLDNLGSRVQLLDRRYFAESVGIDFIEHLGFADDVESIKTAVSGKYYAVCCFAATLKFIEFGLAKTFQPHSLRIKYEPSEGSMMIDLATIRSLELVQNLHDARSRDCLFGLLNETLTAMGARLLRSNILQPLTNTDTLNDRYDAIEELSTKEDMYFAVRLALKPFLDADKILTQLILVPSRPTIDHTEQAINNVMMLKHFVQLIAPIFEALASSRSDILCRILDICAPDYLQPVQDLINGVFNSDTTYARKPLDLRNQRTHAVRAGVNGLLDVARQTYRESMDDTLAHIAEVSDETNLPLQTKYNSSRQFYLTLHDTDLENRNLPDIFINVYRRRGIIECQTLELVKRNQKVNDSHNEVLLMSNQAVQDLIAELRPHMATLFRICEGVAMLDMLCSFAYAVTSREYVRPSISVDSDVLAIRGGRHPIREKIQITKFVPNDVYATSQTRFQIITGCNMSGKSTYIRTVALQVIMAQLGSFVPATYAAFPAPIQQIFARVSPDASAAAAQQVEANISTFAAEMRDTAFILRNVAGPRSLVLVDELGRGTSSRDGLAIAIAIAEALIESRARVWFATHFRALALVLAERPGVVNLHLAAQISTSHSHPDAGPQIDPQRNPAPSSRKEGGDGGAENRVAVEKIEMQYQLAAGAVEATHYGLLLAKLVPLPADVVVHAERVSRALEARGKERQAQSSAVVVARRRKLVLNLKERLLQAQQGSMADADLVEWLRDLQREFVERMTALDEEAGANGEDEVFDVQRGPETTDDEESVRASTRTEEDSISHRRMGHEGNIEIISVDSDSDSSSADMS